MKGTADVDSNAVFEASIDVNATVDSTTKVTLPMRSSTEPRPAWWVVSTRRASPTAKALLLPR